MRWLNFALFFRQIAMRLSGFYLPIFLFQLAPKIEFVSQHLADKTSFQQGLIIVAAFYVLERSAVVLFSIPIGQLTGKIGHARTFVLGDLIFGLLMAFLPFIQHHPLLFFPAAIFSGLKISFFWQSYRTLIDRNTQSGSLGKTVSVQKMVNNFVAMVSPAIGGFVAKYFGYDYVFYIGLGALLIAVVGHLKLKLKEELDQVSWREYFSWLKENTFKQLFFSQAGKYFNAIALMLWPLYVFLLLGDVTTVGITYSLSLFISIVINFFVGDFLDKNHKNKTPFFISGGFLSILTIFKIWTSAVWNVVVMDTLDRMVGNFHWLVYDRIIMARGRGSQDFSYFVYRLVNQSIAGFVFWLLFLSFFLIFSIGWQGVFVLGASGALLSLLAKENKD